MRWLTLTAIDKPRTSVIKVISDSESIGDRSWSVIFNILSEKYRPISTTSILKIRAGLQQITLERPEICLEDLNLRWTTNADRKYLVRTALLGAIQP